MSRFFSWLRKSSKQAKARPGKARLSLEVLEDRTAPAVVNPIIAENQLPGTPQSQWDISTRNAGDDTIQGFATNISVDQGQTVNFKINDTDLAPYRLDIYRMGYYQGNGARLVASIPSSKTIRNVQPDPLTDPNTGLIDAGNWSVTASWAVPNNAVSGIYFAKVIREDTGGASHIVFVVRDDDGNSDLLFQTSDTTWQAYNSWGGNSFYQGSPDGRAYKISYNRPFNTRSQTAKDWVFSAEYPMVRWLEANGYNVSYFTDMDSDRLGAELREHIIFLSVGHDEYWSGTQRANVEAARDAGVNLAFFSGNEVYWKTRWENSIDETGTPYRTLVCYKETWSNAKIDPLPDVWTGTWRDPTFSPPADGGRPENALTGTIFTVNRGSGGNFGTSIRVPEAEGKMRFWRNTTVASLNPGEVAVLANGTLGYEWDEDLDNGFRPAGLIRLSSTTENVPQKLFDYGTRNGVAPGTATHSLTLYRAPSGARVFGAGTVHWSFGLDGNHDGTASFPDVRMQQATVNLFADMGVSAGVLQPGLVSTTASTDVVAPTSTITSPGNGQVFQSGAALTISGMATDTGGAVGGVEIFVGEVENGRERWHPVQGRGSWTYTWTPPSVGTFTLRTQATDDSGNIESPSAGTPITLVPDNTTAPAISGVAATLVDNQTVAISWNTDETSTSKVVYGTSPTSLNASVSDTAMVTFHTITLTGLTPNTIYYYRVQSTDEFTNTSMMPASGSNPNIFTTPAFLDTTVANFSAGTVGSGTYQAQAEDGELILAPTLGTEFSGSTLPTGWSSTPWITGGGTTLANGQAVVDGARFNPMASFGPGRSLEFGATFSGDPYQHVGLGTNLNAPPWMLFSTGTGGALFARTKGASTIDSQIPGNWLGTPHRFRIDWNPSSVTYWIDGVQVATHTMVISNSLRPLISDANPGSGTVMVDWIRLSPYAASDSFFSRIFDAGAEVVWSTLNWTATTPPGTSVLVSVRMGNTPTPDATWTDFIPVASSTSVIGGRSRYLQYRVDLATTNSGQTPTFQDLSLSYDPAFTDSTPPTISSRSPASGASNILPSLPITVKFSELMGGSTFTSTSVRLRQVGAGSDVPATLTFIGATATLTANAALIPDSDYQVTVAGTVKDLAGNALGADVSWTFHTGWLSVGDTTAADFSAGTASSTAVTQSGNGEVTLLASASVDFSGTVLPPDWTVSAWNAGGSATFAGGLMTVDGAFVRTNAQFAPGRRLEFVGTFSGEAYQHIGLAQDLSIPLWAIFSTGSGGALYARTAGPGGATDTLLPGSWLGAAHNFRIDWTPSAISYWIDGVQVASHAIAITANLRPVVSDYSAGGSSIVVDWLRLGPYAPSGNFVSRVFDAGAVVTWNKALWSGAAPAGTSVWLSVRLGNTPAPDAAWTDWLLLAASGAVIGGSSRYIQYRADLATSDSNISPTLLDVTLRYTAALPDTVAPGIISRSPASGTADVNTGSAVIVKFSELMDSATITASTLRLRAMGDSTDVAATVTVSGSSATLQPNASLNGNTQYQVTVSGTVKDLAGNPLGADSSWTFTTAWLRLGDTTAADFSAGTLTGAAVTQSGDGEVALATVVNADFSGTSLPADWTSSPWNTGGVSTVLGGVMTVDAAFARTNALFAPGRSLHFRATFSGDPYQHAGLAQDFSSALWAMFSTSGGGALYARTAGPGGAINTLLPGAWLGSAHDFRIDWTSSAVSYWIDGTQVASHAIAISANLRPVVSDYTAAGGSVVVDWMRLGPFTSSGNFFSRVFDAGAAVTWDSALWSAGLPDGTMAGLSVRMGNTATPEAGWTDWLPLTASGSVIGGRSRYIQYRAELATSDGNTSPVLQDVSLRYTPQADTVAPTLVSRSPAPGATNVNLLTGLTAQFSELMAATTITTATVHLRVLGTATDVPANVTYAGSTVTLQPLAALAGNTDYQVVFNGTITDASGNPLAADISWTFTTGTVSWTQSTAGDFGTGSSSGTVITDSSGGEILLATAFQDDFNNAALGADWTSTSWASAGGGPLTVTVSGGTLSLGGGQLLSTQTLTNSPVEGRINFAASPYQNFGMGTGLSSFAGNYWAMFSTGSTSDRLLARVNSNGATKDVDIGLLPAGFHVYKVKPMATGFEFYVDGLLRTTINLAFPTGTQTRVLLSVYRGSPSLQADWVRIASYVSSGLFTSAVFDATRSATWGTATWTASIPAGTSLIIETRSGDTAAPDASWSDWTAVAGDGTITSPASRYLQYRVWLLSSDPLQTPILYDITFTWS